MLKSATSSPDHTSRDVLIWTFLAGCGILLAMAEPFLAGRIYVRWDLGGFHLPLRAFYAEQLAKHQAFDWMPSIYCGYYFTGEGQAGTYHPWHWLIYKHLALPTALGLEYLASYPLLWAGCWFFLNRRLHHRGAAAFGGLIFTAASYNLLHFIHPNAMEIVAHLPWLLWCIDIILTDRRPRRILFATWALALLTGSQLLLGYPQYVWFSLLTEAAYAGFLLYTQRCPSGEEITPCAGGSNDKQRIPGAWPQIVIGIGLGLLLGAIQWLPTLDALRQSVRSSADSAFTNFGSLHPLNLLQLVAPYLFRQRALGTYPQVLGLYIGAAPLLLVAWLWMQRHELGPLRPLAVAGAAFAACALILAFGRYGMVYELQKYLPGAGSFRYPYRYLLLFQAGMMLLATLGFYLLLGHYRRARKARTPAPATPAEHAPPESSGKRYLALWLTVIGSVTVALGGIILHGNPLIAPPLAVVAGAGLFCYAVRLITQAAAGNRGALVQIILLTAADLGIYGLSNPAYTQTSDFGSYVTGIAVPPGDQIGRVVSCLRPFDKLGYRIGDQITLRGYKTADGYLGLEPRKQLDYRRLPALRVAGVRWVQKNPTTQDIPGIRWLQEKETAPLGRNGMTHSPSAPGASHQGELSPSPDPEWGEVPDPLPRARLVSKTVASADPQNDLDQIDIENTALTEFPLKMNPIRGRPETGTSAPQLAPSRGPTHNIREPVPVSGRSFSAGACAAKAGENTLFPAEGPEGKTERSAFSAELREDQPGRIVVHTVCTQPRLLVLSESYHPGWKARVNGCERAVYRVNGDFLGCRVGPGEEDLVWEFQPDSLQDGRWYSLLGIGLLPLAAVGLSGKSRARKEPPKDK